MEFLGRLRDISFLYFAANFWKGFLTVCPKTVVSLEIAASVVAGHKYQRSNYEIV